MSDDTSKQIKELKDELDRLKAAQPTSYDPAEAARWQDEMHAMRERRMNAASAFSRSQLEEMEAACPTSAVKDIVAHGTIPGPSAAGGAGQVTKVSSNAGIVGSNTSGWRNAPPLGPPPGVAQADRLMAAEDLEFRRQRIKEAAELRAFEKIAAEKSE